MLLQFVFLKQLKARTYKYLNIHTTITGQCKHWVFIKGQIENFSIIQFAVLSVA